MRTGTFDPAPSKELKERIEQHSRGYEGFIRVAFYGYSGYLTAPATYIIQAQFRFKDAIKRVYVSTHDADALEEAYKQKLKETFEPEFFPKEILTPA